MSNNDLLSKFLTKKNLVRAKDSKIRVNLFFIDKKLKHNYYINEELTLDILSFINNNTNTKLINIGEARGIIHYIKLRDIINIPFTYPNLFNPIKHRKLLIFSNRARERKSLTHREAERFLVYIIKNLKTRTVLTDKQAHRLIKGAVKYANE